MKKLGDNDVPSLIGDTLCIKRPTIQANNYELKTR